MISALLGNVVLARHRGNADARSHGERCAPRQLRLRRIVEAITSVDVERVFLERNSGESNKVDDVRRIGQNQDAD